MRNQTRSHRRQRLLDFALYIAIGTSVCVAVILLATYTKVDSKAFRWIGLVGITPITFGYPLSGLPRRLRTRSVWAAWSGLLMLHTALYSLVLSSVKEWPTLNFAIISVFETIAVSIVLDRVVAVRRTTHKPSNH